MQIGMETNDIIYTGLGRAVNDIEAPDGELSISHNIIRDNGSMRPIWIPEECISLEDGETMVFLHRTADHKKNYVVRTGGNLMFFSEDNPERMYIMDVGNGEISVTSIGNTLLVVTSSGLDYVLFKESEYKVLGKKPPIADISFLLNGDKVTTTQEKVSLPDEIPSLTSGETVKLTDNNIEALTTKVQSHVNKFIAEEAEKGNFTSSFFVRWAYVMLGQTYMASAPILMRINEGMFPLVKYIADGTKAMNIYMEAYRAKLMCSFGDITSLLEDWKDIISGVEVYVSSPITRYDQNADVEGVSMKASDTISYSVMDLPIEVDGVDEGIYAKRILSTGSPYLTGIHKDKDAYYSQFVDTSLFYLVRTFKFDELDKWSYVLNGSLQNLEALPALPSDGYQEFDTYIPEGVFVYNGRLNLYGVKEKKHPFKVGQLVQYTNGYDTSGIETEKTYAYKVRFVITSGQSIEITSNENSYLYEEPTYLFYPDNGVDKAVIERVADGMRQTVTVSMKTHPYLQGSYWFNNFEALQWKTATEALSATDGIVNEPNKIYTSEVNNPFIFPLGGINTVGTGDIVGISTITKALSQGQFGQFPLYVFSTDGIWAMEVSGEGLYSSVKPVSRDVCINGKSITQTDNAVLFVSDKGVMMIDGSEVAPMSDMMNGRSFDASSVEMLGDVMDNEGIPSSLKGKHDFMDYARGASMAYDYPNSRVLLYKKGEDFCYVYSLTSGTWATVSLSVDGSVNAYPDTYIQTGNALRNLSERIGYDDEKKIKTLMVSRPVKMGDDGYKTIYQMINRGVLDRSKGALLLWGSHDGEHYTLVADATGNRIYGTGGTAYRYYRIGVVGEMPVGESVSMTSLAVRRKYSNKLR